MEALSSTERQQLASSIVEVGGPNLVDEFNLRLNQQKVGRYQFHKSMKEFKASLREVIENELEVTAAIKSCNLKQENDYYMAHYFGIAGLIDKLLIYNLK